MPDHTFDADRQRALNVIREGRQRTPDDNHTALTTLAHRLRGVLAEAIPGLSPDNAADIRDALLATVSHLGPYLVAGLPEGSAITALAYLADDLDREQVRAAHQPYDDDDHATWCRACGVLWPCPPIRAVGEEEVPGDG
ncbi:MAG TPA: hypothetical protein VE465_13880 [Streptosporangiaceae bacterium]|jgi:hypothetical protein|nr:hypothetical protein [Streptosporangiaceae bacterium]